MILLKLRPPHRFDELAEFLAERHLF